MSSEDDDEEARINRAYKVGQSSGMGMAADIVLEKATRHFKAGRDEFAKEFRDLSRCFREHAALLHPGVPEEKK